MAKQYSVALFVCVLILCGHNSIAQHREAPPVIVSCGSKTLDINKYEILEIRQKFKSAGMDSIVISIRPDSVYKKGDVLYIKPVSVEMDNFLDINKSLQTSEQYDVHTNMIIPVKIKNIDFIKLKKQPLAKVLGTFTTMGYLSFFGSLFVSAGSDQYRSQANQVTLISLPILLTSWTLHAAVAKKRLHFDEEHKKQWKFR